MANGDQKADHEHWSGISEEWITWARAPGHDAFWAYRDALLAFIGRGQGTALDVGCGEGRVSRALKECGYRVTATDPVVPFVAAAAELQSADDYAVASAEALPFADGTFDLAVAYNVLMDIDDVPAALTEIRRVLRPSGTLLISIVHPFADRGRFIDTQAEPVFQVESTYFGRERFEGTEERDGLTMHFAGWSQPLENHMAALEGACFALTSLREPLPSISEGQAYLQRWRRMPLFLWLKARSLAPSLPS